MGGGPQPPLDVIHSWTPNYENPEQRGWGIVILICVLLALTYVVVGLRLWARLRIAKNPGIDDALIAFNMIPLTGLGVAMCLAYRFYGFNHHVWDNPMSVLLKSRQITLAMEQLYFMSTVTTKVSILLFYRRLGSGAVSRGFLYTVYASIAFVIGYFISFSFVVWFHCTPLSAFWLQVDPYWNRANEDNYTCINESAAIISASIISVIQDFLACGMPMVLFWNLRIPRRQKMALAAIFGVGFFLCICGILRIVYVIPIYYTTYDMTWGSHWAWIWLAVESHVAVICASAPALKVFFRSFSASYITSSLRGTSGKHNNATGSGPAVSHGEDPKTGPRTLDGAAAAGTVYPNISPYHRDASESSEQLTDPYWGKEGDASTGTTDIEMGYLTGRGQRDGSPAMQSMSEETGTWSQDSTAMSRHEN